MEASLNCNLSKCSSSALFGQRLRWPLTIAAISAAAFLVSWAMGWCHPAVPFVHDDFSHLLVADTLRHGRLANPAPVLWQPFQSFHVLVQPSYASKFPLGPGGLLALGWCLFGSPNAGIWLGAGLCAGAMTWALAGCMSRPWAALIGMLFALHPGIHHAWSLSFLNGYLSAASGALVAGAVMRLRRRIRNCDAILFGVGVAGLALTRPFEGLCFTIFATLLLAFWWSKQLLMEQVRRWYRLAPWAAIPIVCALAVIAAHNWATTGNVARMAYQLHEAQYGVAPLSILQSPKNPEMEDQRSQDVPPTVTAFHHGWSMETYLKRNHLRGWFAGVAERVFVVVHLWGWLFCIFAVVFLVRQRRALLPIATCVMAALLAATLVPWFYAHYFAPSLVWMVLLTAVGLRTALHRYFVDRRHRRWCVAGILMLQFLCMGYEIMHSVARPMDWSDQRQALIEDLGRSGGQHLILVRYHAVHNVHHEWVYNGADLEGTNVLWARSWRDDLDVQLRHRWQDQRQIWLLQFDANDRPQLNKIDKQSWPWIGNSLDSTPLKVAVAIHS